MWMRGLIVLTLLAACSPAHKTMVPAAKQAASVGRSEGHTPYPVNGYRPGEYLFHGYRCGGDCRLHQKGYDWASQHGITNPKNCRGTSEEFIEGCLAFAGIDGPLGERDFDVSFPHMSGID
jgi:hypothetical protein